MNNQQNLNDAQIETLREAQLHRIAAADVFTRIFQRENKTHGGCPGFEMLIVIRELAFFASASASAVVRLPGCTISDYEAAAEAADNAADISRLFDEKLPDTDVAEAIECIVEYSGLQAAGSAQSAQKARDALAAAKEAETASAREAKLVLVLK